MQKCLPGERQPKQFQCVGQCSGLQQNMNRITMTADVHIDEMLTQHCLIEREELVLSRCCLQIEVNSRIIMNDVAMRHGLDRRVCVLGL